MINQDLFEAISDSAILLDKAGRIINWNSGATLLFGYQQKEVMGRSINLLYERNYCFSKIIQEINQQDKRAWRKETPFFHKNGTKGLCKTHLYSLPLAVGEKCIALVVHHNHSLHQKAEEAWQIKEKTLLKQLTLLNVAHVNLARLQQETATNVALVERKLKESELSFRLLAENATDIISRHSPDGFFLYASPASLHVLDYTPEELLKKKSV